MAGDNGRYGGRSCSRPGGKAGRTHDPAVLAVMGEAAGSHGPVTVVKTGEKKLRQFWWQVWGVCLASCIGGDGSGGLGGVTIHGGGVSRSQKGPSSTTIGGGARATVLLAALLSVSQSTIIGINKQQ